MGKRDWSVRFAWTGCDWNIWDVFWTNQVEMKQSAPKKVASGRRVAGVTRSLVNARGLYLECARILHESLFVPVLFYGSEIMI